MVYSVSTILVLVSLALTLVSGITGRVPLWIPLLLIDVALLAGR